jgi:hypothetical protein
MCQGHDEEVVVDDACSAVGKAFRSVTVWVFR